MEEFEPIDEMGLEFDRPPGEAGKQVRVRQWFPETLLWRPELITDDQGRATIDVDLADSITSWRLTASAVSANGQLGASQSSLRVFQPFFVDLNLPVALTRGDEVAVPVVVYNYLDEPQEVALTLASAPWFEGLDEAEQSITLQPGEVRSLHYRIRAEKVGRHKLKVTAHSGEVADALEREIEIIPNGRPVETVFNGVLDSATELNLNVPDDAVEGSVTAIVRFYPSTFSHVVEGLDGIFQRPYGCFEQTSSTTYPNVLALAYLKRTGNSAPEVEAQARQYIHLGYQRLLTFEVAGGGFDWFGRPPANRTLTAYGLMEFQDMARVHDVDPALIERTRRWLLGQRKPDGTWDPEGHRFHGDPASGGGDLARLSTTAYIAWAVYDGETNDAQSQATLNYLRSFRPNQIDDPYTLALVCNALLAIDPTTFEAQPYLARLQTLRQTSSDGKRTWWGSSNSGRTMFYGAGRSQDIETTSLAMLALIRGKREAATIRGGLSWLIDHKDGRGTWHSTQATVLALKALIAGTGRTLSDEKERRIELQLADRPAERITIPVDQADVMRQIILSDRFTTGLSKLRLSDATNTSTGYQVVLKYYEELAGPEQPEEPLTVQLEYDRTELAVNDSIVATATVTNRMSEEAPMVMLDLPIPAGFEVSRAEFEERKLLGDIEKYEINARSVIVYLRGLSPEEPLTLAYELKATMPVDILALPAVAYEYYDEDKRGTSQSVRLLVQAAP
nr:alpha-2-macroglobulin family protein [Blastopirellula retiformator]